MASSFKAGNRQFGTAPSPRPLPPNRWRNPATVAGELTWITRSGSPMSMLSSANIRVRPYRGDLRRDSPAGPLPRSRSLQLAAIEPVLGGNDAGPAGPGPLGGRRARHGGQPRG